jgi:hypothetical protein
VKPIIVAVFSEIVLFVVITFVFNIRNGKWRVKSMIKMFFADLLLLVLLYVVTPSNFFIFPEWTVIQNHRWIGLVFCIFLYFAGFFGGVLQLYNLSDRGFSLRILIDIYEHPSGRMSLDDIMTGYSRGQGISWMYSKRIEGMVWLGLAKVENNFIVHTDRGEMTARLLCRLRSLFSL